jgi:hypothetical protein
MNTEKHNTQRNICREKKTLQLQARNNFRYTELLKEDEKDASNSVYCVTMEKKKFACKTCLHESFFTLDNAKAWYLIFAYQFLFKCVDNDRIHFNHMDTDSLYISVSGFPYLTEQERMSIHDPHIDPDKKKYLQEILYTQTRRDEAMWNHGENRDKIRRFSSCDQGIEAVIIDREFCNKWRDYFLPKQKKMLGVAIEHTGESEIDTGPKCYAFESENDCIFKAKGFTIKNNKISIKDYEDQVKGAPPLCQGTTQIHSSRSGVAKKTVDKVVLSMHTDKGILQQNQCLTIVPYYCGGEFR